MQLVQAVQENALALVEYVPAPQGEQPRLVLLVPLVAMCWPAVQSDHDWQLY